ncbi:MAG: response regulator transcription factor [Bacteroidaceae bacterium]|nr:response regulator transcription factor [Bacteroidaceae bacterium]
MNILIIEDEQNSALRLKRLIESVDSNYTVIGMVASNAEAKTFFTSQHPVIDLILSDIQLGDGLSFEALRCAPVGVPVIFTTAYDQYAVQAFKFNSLDYLLKPIDETELRAALQKVQTIKTTATNTDAITQLLDVLGKGPIRYRERFLIPHKADEFLIIPANEVSHFVIQDGVVRLCTLSGVRHQLGMTLDEVESQLDPQRFMRVNRQYIVNASAVDKLSAWFQGKLRIYIKGFPDDEITVSKEKVSAVKRWLDS